MFSALKCQLPFEFAVVLNMCESVTSHIHDKLCQVAV